uniref:Putative secreted protein n=1 Tax=Ixodes ricinus TaxID=34613 RepID=A0A6B0TXV9_IXORI
MFSQLRLHTFLLLKWELGSRIIPVTSTFSLRTVRITFRTYVLSESSGHVADTGGIEQCTQGIVVLHLKHFENFWHQFIETLDP